jgi:HK97 family phage major capsid protein
MSNETPSATLGEIKRAIDGSAEAFETWKQMQGEKFAAMQDRLEQLESKGSAPRKAGSPKAAHPLDQIEGDEVFAAFKAGKTNTAKIEVKNLGAAIVLGTKGNLTGDGGGSPAETYPVHPARVPGIFDIRRPLDFLSVVPMTPAGQTNTAQFVRLLGETSSAGVQAGEGSTKASKSFHFELDSAPIRTYAVTAAASRQVLDDAAGLRDFITSRLLFETRALLEAEIITGASSLVSGISEEAVPFGNTASAAADKVGEAVADLRSRHGGDVVILLHPQDWQAIAAERSADTYFTQGWMHPPAPTMWGSQVVVSRSVTQNTGLVFSRDAVRLFPREDAVVLFGTVGDQFSQNMLTILAELRAGFAVVQPALVWSVAV